MAEPTAPFPSLRVIVCGGRKYHERAEVFEALNALEREYAGSLVIVATGGAQGADALARQWVEVSPKNRRETTFFPLWQIHGKQAGPIRNQQMIDVFRPQLVIAFPGGNGTQDMIRRAEAARVPVRKCGRTVGFRHG